MIARRIPDLASMATALAAVVALAWLGLTGFAWSDYEVEAAAPFAALADGDVVEFLARCPAYGGALVLRAPFASLTSWLGGGELAVYRAVSVPCLVVGAWLGVALARRAERWGWVALLVAAANPVTLRALEVGHPEELMGGAFCVAAVIAASDRRTLLSGALLGLAVATKAWAVLAIGPVLLALPAGSRLRAMLVATPVAAAVLLPLLAAGSASAGASAAGPTGSVIFQPWQLFWWLGETGQTVIGGNGLPKPDGWRTPPAWLSPLTHPLIAALVVPASLAWWRTRRAGGAHALLLLAILFLARCVLDPWNTGYYAIPFLLALLAWEVLCRPGRPPVLALGATVAVWASFEWIPLVASPDVQSVAYLAWALPLGACLLRAAWPERLALPIRPRLEAAATPAA